MRAHPSGSKVPLILNFRREILLPLSVVAGALVLSIATVIYFNYQHIEDTREATAIDQLRFNLLQLHDTVIAAETGQRGYLLTNNATFLSPYYEALDAQKTLLREIESNLKNYPSLRTDYQQIVKLIHFKIDIIEKTLQVQLNAGSYASHLTLTKDQGKFVMEQINEKFQVMDQSLVIKKEQLSQQAQRRLMQIILGSILLIGIVAGLFIFSYRQTLKMFQRISDTHHLADALRIEAHYDGLTQVHNRRGFVIQLEELFAQALKLRSPFAILYLDLDGFKQINDTLGHDIGDEALRICVQRFKRILREEDTIARLGGDEFAILVRRFNDLSELSKLAKRLVHSLRAGLHIGTHHVKLGVSIGIASFPYHATTKETLLTAADDAMYMAKRAGKNQFKFISQPLPAE